METKSIEIDTETNALIEARRKSFKETENDIIKRCLKQPPPNTGSQEMTIKQLDVPRRDAKKRSSRSSGIYDFTLLGKPIQESSLRSAYLTCLRALQARDSGFFERLSLEETPGRRLVAKNPRDLYKKSPDLAESHAEKVDGIWYVDLNLSEPQVVQRLKIACRVAGLEFGSDLVLDFH
ncbi:MAG: hypothetical protein JXJ18_12695 [Rhodobacteraceae bacterium]|nr:hypothetical protein [Paracoccaceae bacterium]